MGLINCHCFIELQFLGDGRKHGGESLRESSAERKPLEREDFPLQGRHYWRTLPVFSLIYFLSLWLSPLSVNPLGHGWATSGIRTMDLRYPPSLVLVILSLNCKCNTVVAHIMAPITNKSESTLSEYQCIPLEKMAEVCTLNIQRVISD